MKKLLMLLVLMLMIGCATGSKIMVGTRLNAIRPDQVSVAMSLSKDLVKGVDYKEVAILKAQCSTTWMNEEGATDKAIEKLKSMAAEIGANLIIIQGFDDESQVEYNWFSGGYYHTNEQEVKAVALYIYPPTGRKK